ncbi:ABC transporter permease [Planosporangium thailandense]|uniref:ABC transporter permease n=1 Tax=Planosporangium thailandense TaxID=765197 RepID=A0ABX0XT43_9ACTN|nr:ABC transporter permease [Planosporangium thailandense]NJC68454.1 ABC transporter permease [Planosporangium thailandense]
MATDLGTAERTITGLDALDLADRTATPRGARVWAAAWPKVLALGLAVGLWQVVVWSGWRPEYILPAPATVAAALVDLVRTGGFWSSVVNTAGRALSGYSIAIAIGLVLGVAVARIRVLRAAIGSMITALQTMPSIAWFPLAIVLFQLSEQAILFVVVLGAAPSIANGVIAGVDYVPPLLLRAGRNIGARGWRLYRYVIGPASLPHIVSGLKQGWAFCWRSLMAGELLVIIPGRPAVGTSLEQHRGLSEYPEMMADMIVILVIGLLVDAVFGAADRAVRTRWGITENR